MKPALLEEFYHAGLELFLQDGQLMAGVRKGCTPSPEVLAQAKAMKAEIMAAFQKPKYPSIWDVTIQTKGKVQTMIVIDPLHEDEATFKRELVERFGEQRLVMMKRRT